MGGNCLDSASPGNFRGIELSVPIGAGLGAPDKRRGFCPVGGLSAPQAIASRL